MKILARAVAVMSATALLAGCGPASLGSGKSPETKVVVVTQEADATGGDTRAGSDPQVVEKKGSKEASSPSPAKVELNGLREVDPSTVMNDNNGFVYDNGSGENRCSLRKGTLICAGKPPAGTPEIPDRGAMARVGAVEVTPTEILWAVSEKTGFFQAPVIQTGTKFTKDGFTCGKPDTNTFGCVGSAGAFKIVGETIELDRHPANQSNEKQNSSSFDNLEFVSPDRFLGTQGVRVFNFRNGGTVVGYCILDTYEAECSGKPPSGNGNSARVSGNGIKYVVSEGPLEGKLKELKAGQQTTYGQVTCRKPDAESLTCGIGTNMITVKGPEYRIIEHG